MLLIERCVYIVDAVIKNEGCEAGGLWMVAGDPQLWITGNVLLLQNMI